MRTGQSTKKHDPELYCADLEWLIQQHDRDMGESGNLSSVIATLERGGYCSPSADVIESMISRLHWARHAVDRSRRIMPRWRRLAGEHQRVLTARYSTCELPTRASALLGCLATVALMQASDRDHADAKPRALRALLRALERGDTGYCRKPERDADRAVRAAHRAWAATLDDEEAA